MRTSRILLLLLVVLTASCADTDSGVFGDGDEGNGCKPVTVASSPEKLELLTALAN